MSIIQRMLSSLQRPSALLLFQCEHYTFRVYDFPLKQSSSILFEPLSFCSKRYLRKMGGDILVTFGFIWERLVYFLEYQVLSAFERAPFMVQHTGMHFD